MEKIDHAVISFILKIMKNSYWSQDSLIIILDISKLRYTIVLRYLHFSDAAGHLNIQK